jgi:hypothetical protein
MLGALSIATAGGIETDWKSAGSNSSRPIATRAMSGLEFETVGTQRDLLSSS